MDILPMDVIQIMINLYYTPQLKSIEDDNQFYLQIIYPIRLICACRYFL